MPRRLSPAAGRVAARLLLGLSALLAGLLLALAGLTVALLDTQPALTRSAALGPKDIALLSPLWQRVHPLRLPVKDTTPVALSAREVDLLVHEAAARLLKGAATVRLRPAAADFQVSAPLPRSPFPMPVWLNLSGSLRERAQGLPEVTALRLGSLPLPPGLAEWALRQVAAREGLDEVLNRGLTLVTQVGLEEAGATVHLRGNPSFADSLRAALVPPPLREALAAYHQRLVALAAGPADAPPLELRELVGPLFRLAAQRTALAGGDDAARTEHAALENRAALLTLALYVNGKPLTSLVPAASRWPQPRARVVLGAGREDRPQHLFVSAVLTAEGNGRLADALGVLKEVSDRSSEGSGFSFDDLAVDRAGRRLGQLALQAPLALQQRLAAVKTDAELLPDTDGLPSFLDEAAFRTAIGTEGSARYQALMADIDARVAAVPALR